MPYTVFVRANYFEHQREVRPEDIDVLGHVNNAVYLQYIEDCARLHAEARGLSLEGFKATGAVPMIREHKLTYYAQAKLGDTLSVSTEVLELSGPKALRRSQVRRVDSGGVTRMVEAYTLWVWISVSSGRPIRAPEVIKASFGF